jgi:hypothetical protein
MIGPVFKEDPVSGTTVTSLIAMGVLVLLCAGCSGGNGNQFSLPQQPPPIEGDWHLSSRDCLVKFAQEGTKLTGSGLEAGTDGRGPFMIENGKVEGTNVHFDQKFTRDSSGSASGCSGVLSFHDSPRYKGWMMEGIVDGPGLLQGLTCWYAWKGIPKDEFRWAGAIFSSAGEHQGPNRLQGDYQTVGDSDRILVPQQQPLLSGTWRFFSPTFFTVTLKQEGTKLTGYGDEGQGKGLAGRFVIEDGTVEGRKVQFVKKYVNPTVHSLKYNGDLAFHYAPYYKGWVMEGDWVRLALPYPAHNFGISEQQPCTWVAFRGAESPAPEK